MKQMVTETTMKAILTVLLIPIGIVLVGQGNIELGYWTIGISAGVTLPDIVMMFLGQEG